MDNDNGPCSRDCLDLVILYEVGEPSGTVFKYSSYSTRQIISQNVGLYSLSCTLTPQTYDLWRTFERAEQHCYSAIVTLQKMADGLIAASCEIHVPESLLIYNAKI